MATATNIGQKSIHHAADPIYRHITCSQIHDSGPDTRPPLNLRQKQHHATKDNEIHSKVRI